MTVTGQVKEDMLERRFFTRELRVDQPNGGAPRITGYAAVFNQLSKPLGGFREKIKPGAFDKTIQESDVRALFNHDANFVLGRSKNNTLELSTDETGLLISVEPPDTSWARDLMASIRRGDVNQMSFGFRTIRDEWNNEKDKNGDVLRTLLEVRLLDVSVVTFAAYPQTSAQVRSQLAAMQSAAAPPQEGHPADGDAQAGQQVLPDVLRRRIVIARNRSKQF